MYCTRFGIGRTQVDRLRFLNYNFGGLELFVVSVAAKGFRLEDMIILKVLIAWVCH